MEYWKESYDELNYEISALQNQVNILEFAIDRAKDNIFSLTNFGNLSHDDDSDYEGKSICEKLEIAKEIISDSENELAPLTFKLNCRKEVLARVSKAIIDSTYWFMNCCFNNSQLLSQKQKEIFIKETNEKVGNVLGKRI